MKQDKHVLKHISTLVQYLHKHHDCNVYFRSGVRSSCYYSWIKNEIYIGKHLSYTTQLITLLHEAGHVYRIKHHLDIGKSNKKNTIKIYNTPAMILREEIEAWNQGYQISTLLHIPININQYWNQCHSAINTYLIHYYKH